jgi:hypothetical protein
MPSGAAPDGAKVKIQDATPSTTPSTLLNTRHSYISFLFSIGARSTFISTQTGDSIKTLETHYVKYIPDADSMRDLVEERIRESAKSVQSGFKRTSSHTRSKQKKEVEKSTP